MPEKKTAFYAYPGKPTEIAQTIQLAIVGFNGASPAFNLEGWEKNDISGIPLTAPIFSKISTCEFLAIDVTYLNENVAFETGYAIGSKKRCLLFVNSAHTGDRELANNIGIFDTLGYEQYENSEMLTKLLVNKTDYSPIEFEVAINHQQPVYIVEPAKKDDAHLLLVSRTKKARWKYRSFNPDEDVRLSASDAIRIRTYAQDLVIEVDRELGDVFLQAKKLVYEFSEENAEFSHDELSTLVQCIGLDEASAERVISLLLYYGVFGVRKTGEETIYIYEVNYDIEMLRVRIRKWGESTKYIVNPALWPALKVKSGDQPSFI